MASLFAAVQSNHPPLWSTFDRHFADVHRFRGFTTVAKVNRFDARYRLAASFQRIELGGGFKEPVRAGYQALLHLTLTWSAFEMLELAIHRTRAQISASSNWTACCADLHAIDGAEAYFAFLSPHLKERERGRILPFLEGGECCGL